jgi:hypothetical protein
MGNQNGRESGASDNPYPGRRRSVADPSPQNPSGDNDSSRNDRPSAARNRTSRAELSFLGIGSSARTRERNREDEPFTHKETKAEREARRLERERAARAKEREKSTAEEHVDGGYLVTLGTYTGTEDFSKPTVRQLQVGSRRFPIAERLVLTMTSRSSESWHRFGED